MPRLACHLRHKLGASQTRLLAALGLMALLSACAQQPQLTSEQESGQYRSHARRSYTTPGPANDPWRPYVKEASERFDVPERWIREVMRQESGGKALAQSGPGAMGLMQVMPGTYDELRGRYRDLGLDAFDPHDNIMAGTAYIRELYDIYGSPGFLAAYNAGPGRLDDYLTRGRTLPSETRRYVAAIGPRISGTDPTRASPGAAYAMNAIPLDIPAGPRYAPDQRYSATPVQVADATPMTPIVLGQPTPGRFTSQPFSIEPTPVRQAVQVASLPDAVPPIVLGQPTPERFAAAPTPLARTVAVVTPLPLPPPPSPAQQFAAFAPRTMAIPPPPPQPTAQVASYMPSAARGGFHLVAPAMAEPIGRPRATALAERGAWAVQVGAFANDRLAASANAAARDTARELSSASATVSSVHQGSSTLYRARLHGLSREGAQQACERLSRQHMNCILVSPDAQS